MNLVNMNRAFGAGPLRLSSVYCGLLFPPPVGKLLPPATVQAAFSESIQEDEISADSLPKDMPKGSSPGNCNWVKSPLT